MSRLASSKATAKKCQKKTQHGKALLLFFSKFSNNCCLKRTRHCPSYNITPKTTTQANRRNPKYKKKLKKLKLNTIVINSIIDYHARNESAVPTGYLCDCCIIIAIIAVSHSLIPRQLLTHSVSQFVLELSSFKQLLY